MRSTLFKTWKIVKTYNNQTVESTKQVMFRFKEKIKGTRYENWLKYWENVFKDYKEVTIDVGKEMKEKPLKAIAYMTVFGGATYLVKTRPDELHFRDAFIKNYTDLILVHPSQQNPKSFEHLRHVERLYNAKLLRTINAGLFTIIWTDEFSEDCKTYESICPYLQLQYKNFVNHIIDIGVMNHWIILSQKMYDYDVNIE